MTTSTGAVSFGRWTRAERIRLSGVVAVIALLHVAGWSLYFYYARNLSAATAFAGAGTLAYALGVRHAFDADHIAAIDDTTRLMLARNRRPVGVGFFFAMGHSSVVLMLSFVVAIAADAASAGHINALREYTVYLAGLLVDHVHVGGWLPAYAAIGNHFQLLGYAIVSMFVIAWVTAALTWRLGGFARRYAGSA